MIVRNQAAQCIAYIATMELPLKQWTNLIEVLLENMTSETSSNDLKSATLICLGSICEDGDANVIVPHSNGILSAIIQGLRETSDEIKVAAIRSLVLILRYCTTVFENDEDRSFLMGVLKESSVHPEERIRRFSFQCFVEIAALYYEHLNHDIQDIFNITHRVINEDVESVALQAVEFWCTVCDKEIDLMERITKSQQMGLQPNLTFHGFINGSTKFLADLLCSAVLRSETSDIEEYNLSAAASTCLSLMANTVKDAIVDYILPFVEQNIQSADERHKEASILVFGSILEGPSPEKMEKSHQAVQFFFALMKDANVMVRTTTSWTLSRIANHHYKMLLSCHGDFLNVLSDSLNDVSQVAANICKTIAYYSDSCGDEPVNPLVENARDIITALIHTSQRDDASENSLRSSAYYCINSLILNALRESKEDLVQLAVLFMDQMRITDKILDEEVREEVQCSLCGTLQALTIALGHDVHNILGQMMQLYIEIINAVKDVVYEEIFIGSYRILQTLKADFAPFTDSMLQYIIQGINTPSEQTVFQYSVFFIADLTQYVFAHDIAKYLEHIVPPLLQSIEYLHMSLENRANTLTSLGRIACMAGESIQPYFNNIMSILIEAADNSMSKKLTDVKDEQTYSNTMFLRENVLESFIFIIQVPKEVGITQQHAVGIIQLIIQLMNDLRSDDVTYLSLQLLGEVAGMFADTIHINWLEEFKGLIQPALNSENESIREVATWCHNELSSLVK